MPLPFERLPPVIYRCFHAPSGFCSWTPGRFQVCANTVNRFGGSANLPALRFLPLRHVPPPRCNAAPHLACRRYDALSLRLTITVLIVRSCLVGFIVYAFAFGWLLPCLLLPYLFTATLARFLLLPYFNATYRCIFGCGLRFVT
jgi:hypothetical protein